MAVVLSSSVRQNLLSLQSTADLLATTQSRLSTGKKVNTALDNPTNFFTAQSLDSRATDISNLLDGIGNGVQVLQAGQHRHHLALQAGRYRQVDRQPGAADHGRLLDQVQRVGHDLRRDLARPARHHHLHQRDRDQQRASPTAPPAASTAITSADLTSAACPRAGWNCGQRQATAPPPSPPRSRCSQRPRTRQPVCSATRSRPTVRRLTVNGKTITFKAGTAPAAASAPDRLRHRSGPNVATDGKELDDLSRHQLDTSTRDRR